ncbi:hypothetical protein MNEG_1517 [Monoraphidium neglectum]|uniref:Gamma-tubulin complex component n=1 Tax=Monoraphidium neglectum TaxID=145388 RepID=A0A0D2LJ05_9CHLO|nr:hypothetical protein MNEG_1517 [Monoraphidium neglectum]KIZ06439.1 hypothetical protein MNEG_1517 [Monoraphidium neglectum]|eukprot:XP_013905458.1 hypothetical protein MNEG_1517 [Monoraphidium neglectum]
MCGGELLHAPKAATPLPRFLFNAAVQPLLRRIRQWAFRPSHAAAAAFAAAAADSFGEPGPGVEAAAGAAAAAALPLRTGAAADALAGAWDKLQRGAPPCPGFLSRARRDLEEAGRQLQLLQLLGGAPAALARRLGALADAEARELRLILSSGLGPGKDAPRAQRPGADTGGHSGGRSGEDGGSDQLTLLLRGGSGRGGGGGGSDTGAPQGAESLDIGMSLELLGQIGEAVEEYGRLRAQEAEHLLGLMGRERGAAAAAEHAAVVARWHEKAAQQEAAREARLLEAAGRRARRAELLQQQRRAADERAQRPREARRAALAEERALLAADLRAERRRAEEELAQELARCSPAAAGRSPPGALAGPAAGAEAEAALVGVVGEEQGAAAAGSERAESPISVDDVMLQEAQEGQGDGAGGLAASDTGGEGGARPTADAASPPPEAAAAAGGARARRGAAAQSDPGQRAAGIVGPRPTWGAVKQPFAAAGAAARGQETVASILGGGGSAGTAVAPAPVPARRAGGIVRQRSSSAGGWPQLAAPPSRWGAAHNPFPAAGQLSAAQISVATVAQPAHVRQQPQQQQEAQPAGSIAVAGETASAVASLAAINAARSGAVMAAAEGQEGPAPASGRLVGGRRRPLGDAAPLPLVLEVAVTAPLAAQARLVTGACWRLLVSHWDLPAAIRSLAHLYFHGAGDLADFLAAGAEGMLSAGRAPPPAVAQAALEAAVHPDRRVLPASSADAGGLETDADAAAVRGLELGDSLVLTCQVPWPLSLVVAPSHLGQYADVFSALLRARRASLRLDALWRRLCTRGSEGEALNLGGGGDGAAAGAARVKRLRRWLHLAAHCARSWRAFAHEQLLCGTCEALARQLEAAPMSVAGMRAAHAGMLARALRACLLPPAPRDSDAAAAAEAEPPWLAPLAADVNGLVSCCWRLQALAAGALTAGEADGGGSVEPGGGWPQGGAADGGGDGGGGWERVEAVAAELEAQLGRARERLGAAAASDPTWQGLLARLG